MFRSRNIGKTLVTKTQGTKIASDGLKGCVFEVSDIQTDQPAFRKLELLLRMFRANMDLTHDKMCAMGRGGSGALGLVPSMTANNFLYLQFQEI